MSEFKPKGPFPLFISDFEKDTRGWTGDERWQYLRLLNDMWWNGGFIEDDDGVIAEAMGLNRARNWREKVEKVRLKLVSHDEKPGFLTQGKVLKEVRKAAEISRKRAKAGKVGGEKGQANAKQMPKPPSPSPSPGKEEPSGSSKTRAREPEGFSEFYSAYPRKVGRKDALKAWQKAKDKPPLPELLAAIERYIAAKPPDRSYCNPATWLNQGRWMDEHDEPASRTNTGKPNSPHQTLHDGFAAAAARFGPNEGPAEPSDDWPDNPSGGAGLPGGNGAADATGGHAENHGPDSGVDGALLDTPDAGEPTGSGSGGLGPYAEGTAVECRGPDGFGVGENEGAPPDARGIPEDVGTVH